MLANRLDPAYGALLLRVALGTMFLAHGLLKVLVFTIPGTVGFFASLGLPAVVAYATIAAEVIGGLALILGVYTRVAALALVPIIVGATWVHAGNGWLFTAPNGGWEYPAFLTFATVAQVFLGGGAHALKDDFEAAPRSAAAPAE